MKLAIKTFLIIMLISSARVYGANDVIKKSEGVYYRAGEVIVKVKEGAKGLLKSGGSSAFPELSKVSVYKTANVIENDTAFEKIYSIEFSSPQDPEELAKELAANPNVLWAEPRYIYKTEVVPNDPMYGQQPSLTSIKAAAGWDIEQGNSGVIIAIVDTGVDWQHEDLSSKIWTNSGEVANNGVDDDGNGYIDDVRGWDFGGLTGTPDNNPREDNEDHGTHVAGIAAAATNNSKGIAGVGYNCTIMPVKTARNDVRDNGDALIYYGYEGIYYAASNGAKIINCSWGGYSYSNLGQETIDYAMSKGALVVAAAGNDGTSDTHYPSGYIGVLSVAATFTNDIKPSFSNYGLSVDVAAPGVSVLSTWQSSSDPYITLSGTSMSSPHAAGLAGLLAAHYPNLTPGQIGEVIRVNSDNIDDLNPSYRYGLGSGRINAENALKMINSKSVRLSSYTFSDAEYGNGDGNLQPGETVTLETRFINYLDPLSSLTVTLESLNSNAVVENNALAAGAIGTLIEFGNTSNKFTFTIPDGAGYDASIVLKLNYSDDGYGGWEIITAQVNNSYGTQSGGNISLSIASNGAFSFADYPSNVNGSGFKYKGGRNLLFEGAFMVGTSATALSDAARNGDEQNRDFDPIQMFIYEYSDSINGYIGHTIFTDDKLSNTTKLGVKVDLTTYTFNEEAYSKFILMKYTVVNLNSTPLNGVYAGLFLDWDISESGGSDRSSYNTDGAFGYVHDMGDNTSPIAGAALVSSNRYNFYSILNGAEEGIEIYDNFTKAEKWTTLSSGIGVQTAGTGDVSFVVSGGPYDIAGGDTLVVVFAIAAGDDFYDFSASISAVRSIFQQYVDTAHTGGFLPLTFEVFNNYPNPFNPQTVIPFQIPKAGRVTVKVYDALGRHVETLLDDIRQPGYGDHAVFNGAGRASGVYFYTIQYDGKTVSKKMMLVK